MSGPSSVDPEKKPVIWNNLGPRAVSAVIFAVICLIPLYIGGYIWAVFVLILGLRLVWEWVNMSDPARTRLALAIPIAGMAVTIGYIAAGQIKFAILAVIITALLAGLERSRRGGGLWALLGTPYIFIPAALLVALRGHEFGFSGGLAVLLFIILVVIGADTGAYFGGSAFKGPKMAPKLSPKKTWSGFVSGLIAGTLIGLAAGCVLGMKPSLALALAIPIVITSVLGDFLESGLKRKLNVKDAGALMPGHGGLLDRVDSLMMAVTASAIALAVFPNLWPSAL